MSLSAGRVERAPSKADPLAGSGVVWLRNLFCGTRSAKSSEATAVKLRTGARPGSAEGSARGRPSRGGRHWRSRCRADDADLAPKRGSMTPCSCKAIPMPVVIPPMKWEGAATGLMRPAEKTPSIRETRISPVGALTRTPAK